MQTKFSAYNMDPNNKTPLECVPHALFKMYGDKTKPKNYYNGKIANGGMEYVKQMLDIGGEPLISIVLMMMTRNGSA